MIKTTYTLTKEELQELINQAVITVTSSIQLIPELISENELSKRLNLSKVTLHKYRKDDIIPYLRIGRTIRYNYKEVLTSIKTKK